MLVNAHDIELHTGEKDIHGILSQKITFRLYKNSMAVMSRTQAKLFERKYERNPCLLQLPIIDYYSRVSSIKNDVKNQIREDKNILKFFFFGSIMPYKGIERLLDAARILEEKGINPVINIYGRLKYNNESFLEKMKKLKCINFIDEFIDYRDVSRIYDQNDVLIIPYIQVSQCGPLLIGFSRNVPPSAATLKDSENMLTKESRGYFLIIPQKDLLRKWSFLYLIRKL